MSARDGLTRARAARTQEHQIADRLLAAASAGEAVVYAVPGDPCVAEMTVRLLRERAAPAGVEVRLRRRVLAFFRPPLLTHTRVPP